MRPSEYFLPHIARMHGYVPGEQPQEGGYIKLPAGPGLGVELDLDAVAERPYRARVPEAYIRYREDGSIEEL